MTFSFTRFCVFGFTYIFLVSNIFFSGLFIYTNQSLVRQAKLITVNTDLGEGPVSSCQVDVSINLINTTVEFLLCSFSDIIDPYIGSTENLLSNSDSMAALFKDNLFNPIQKISLLILPVSLIVRTLLSILSTGIFTNKEINIYETFHNFTLNLITIILLPEGYSLLIDLNNAICQSIIASTSKGSIQITASIIHMITNSESFQSGILPAIINNILWGGFFIALLFVGLFFLIRFILIWVIFLAMPIVISLDGFIPITSFKEGLITKLVQFLLVQPVFLIAISFLFFLMKFESDGLVRFFLTISTMMCLGFLPSFLAGISGGKLAAISSRQIKDIYIGIVQRAGIALDWLEEDVNEPYHLPYDKPEKL